MDSVNLKYFISFLVGLGASPFFVLTQLYAQGLGANDITIGLVVASYCIATVLSYTIFGRFSDLYAIRKALIVAGLFFMGITLALHYFALSIGSLLFARFIYGIATGIYTGPMLAYIATSDHYKVHMSSFYGFGSLGWVFGYFASTYLLNFFSYTKIFLIFSIPVFTAFLFSTKIKKEKIARIEVPLLPVKLIKRNLAIYLSFFIRHACAHAMFIFLPIFMLITLKAPLEIIGPIYAMNPLVQFFVMNSIPKFKLKSRTLFRIGLLLSSIAFVIVGLSMNYYFILLPLAIIGVAWSFLSVGANLVLVESNIEKATVTGLLWSVSSLALISGSIIGGLLSHIFGLREMILIVSAVSFFAFVIEIFLKNK